MWLRIKLKYLKDSSLTSSLGILDQRIKTTRAFLLLFPALVIIVLFTLIPFMISVNNSLTVVGSKVSDTYKGVSNFWSLFALDDFRIGLRNSLVYGIVSVPISLMISLLISALIVSVIKKWVRQSLLTVFFLPYVTSTVAVSLTFYQLLSTDNGLINQLLGVRIPWLTGDKYSLYSLASIIIHGVWTNLSLQILILTTAMLSVNVDLYRACAIDGVSGFKKFTKITLPSINQTLNFLITVGIISGIKVFPLALYNNVSDSVINSGASTLMFLVFLFTKDGGQTYYLSGAVSIILFLIGLIVSYTMKGLIGLVTNLSVSISDNRVQNKIKVQQLVFK